MVGLTYIYDNSEQLNLVQETHQELKFQFDRHRHTEAIAKKRFTWIKTLISSASCLFFVWYCVKANLLSSVASTFSYPAVIPLIAVLIFSFLIITYLSPNSIAWVFDSPTRQLKQTAHRLFWGRSTRSFPFDSIREIVVDKDQDSDNEHRICAYIYIVLTSGKAIKLSQSGYFTDMREKAIALKHHQEIARKMRERVGLKSAILDDDIYIPSEREVTEKREETLRSTKELFSSIFSTKSEKALKIRNLKLITTQKPHDAQSWEELAMLYIQDKDSIQDGIRAYRQAELLYRDQGNIDKADLIRSMLKRMKAY
jgi:hypothetical protein